MPEVERYLDTAMTIKGKTRRNELLFLWNTIMDYGATINGPIVEIGTYYGRMTYVLAQTGHDLYSIDNYCEGHSAKNPEDGERPELATVYGEWPDKEFPPNLTLLQHDSAEASCLFEWPELGVFVLDGGHTREQVAQDCFAWLPKIHVGGLAFFHDYGNPNWPDVKPAVDDYLQSCKFTGQHWTNLGQVRMLAAFKRVVPC